MQTRASQQNHSIRDFGARSLWQVPAIAAIALALALCVNSLRPDGIALVRDGSVAPRAAGDSTSPGPISLDEARRLFETGGAVFVDARSQTDYAIAHIQGAVSLPWQQIDEHFPAVADRLDGAGRIVSYCDGESCELSHFLASFLREMGYADVRVLVNGLTLWRGAGLPVEGR